jgi:hypothetical protein
MEDEMGFNTWKLEDGRTIALMTPAELAKATPGEVLTCIDGTTARVGFDLIDDDTRAGLLAYGRLVGHA